MFASLRRPGPGTVTARRLCGALAVTVLLAAAGPAQAVVPESSRVSQSSACATHSGKQLAGKHLTQQDIDSDHTFRCADLRGADLAGLSLTQDDFTGADLSGADLHQADLTQAEWVGATLAKADLSHADLTQANVSQADLTGANLTGADLTQADLTGARLDGAALSGAQFTQAELDDATFEGVTGVTRWDLYLLIGAAGLFVVLALRLLVVVGRAPAPAAVRARRLVFGLAGRLLVVLALHMFIGFMIGQVVASGVGDPVQQTCQGPQCAVGVGLGMAGPYLAVGAGAVGVAMLTWGQMRTAASARQMLLR
ncbi:pentapeptide repeat-containing protein [Streptomyces cavernae]|uniref:pentapeptide repeat-containing protein n=1 Tax=Streptomyces cavernae TaxID=2259034 RepID=UPI000FEB84E4|nr:pentapeptide repeat-containing protein [Streptomyces cavernae]